MATFTIEQIELIRRLRNSGITKDELIKAFETLERLDGELGPIYNTPSSTLPIYITTPSRPSNNINLTNHHLPVQNGQAITPVKSELLAQRQAPSGNAHYGQAQFPNHGLHKVSPATAPILNHLDEGSVSCGTPDASGTILYTSASMSSQRGPGQSANLAPDEEDSDELKEFMKQGEAAMYDEIKAFVHKFSIKQAQIGAMTGISQSYISRYLRGDYSDMSERCRKAIYTWYINTKQQITKVTAPILSAPPPAVSPFKKMPSVTEPVEVDLVGLYSGSSPAARRERFTFRQCHLEILEACFKSDPYPSFEKRDEISNGCNTSVNIGRELFERERVTPQIVSNWFTNRRKELKRIAREEGVDLALLPQVGRPPRSLRPGSVDSSQGLENPSPRSDLSSDEQESLGSLYQAHTPPSASNGSHSNIMVNPLGQQSLNNLDHFEEENGMNQNLSLAVEVAAVNQAIMSLSGQSLPSFSNTQMQQRNNVKQEAHMIIDDDSENENLSDFP